MEAKWCHEFAEESWHFAARGKGNFRACDLDLIGWWDWTGKFQSSAFKGSSRSIEIESWGVVCEIPQIDLTAFSKIELQTRTKQLKEDENVIDTITPEQGRRFETRPRYEPTTTVA